MIISKETRIAAARNLAKARTAEKLELDRQREDLLAYAAQTRVGVVHIYDKLFPKGGLTVAFRKMSKYESGIMVEVAVATCSNADSFSKKTGTLLALGKFADGEVISLPLYTMKDEGLAYNVKTAFAALYFAVN